MGVLHQLHRFCHIITNLDDWKLAHKKSKPLRAYDHPLKILNYARFLACVRYSGGLYRILHAMQHLSIANSEWTSYASTQNHFTRNLMRCIGYRRGLPHHQCSYFHDLWVLIRWTLKLLTFKLGVYCYRRNPMDTTTRFEVGHDR